MRRRRAPLSLRARFVVLIVGSAIVPPVVFAVAAVIVAAVDVAPVGTSTLVVARYLMRASSGEGLTVQQLADQIESEAEPGAPSEPTEASPKVFLLDGDGLLRVPRNRTARAYSVAEVVAEATAGGLAYVSVFPVPDETGGTGYAIVASGSARIITPLTGLGFLVPIAFVVFFAVTSALIIRSINASITRLEAATRQIAEGDLDFRLEPDGRDALASLTRSFETMRQRLKEQLERNARFLMGLSHDLKTPLASISGYVGAIRDGHADDAERLDRYLAIIQEKSGLLEARIRSLIDFAKQETSEWKANLVPVDVAELLGESMELAGDEASARGFVFDSSLDVEPGTIVNLDRVMTARALENLLDNAFLYTPPGGRIGYSAAADREKVVVRIANSGPGIAATDLPHVFEPLYRAANDRRGSGMGLGLAIVRSVIASHGWTVDVGSEPGGETAFTVTIPLPESEDAARGRERRS